MKHSENEIQLHVYDLLPYVKVKKADDIRWRLLYCSLVPGMTMMSVDVDLKCFYRERKHLMQTNIISF